MDLRKGENCIQESEIDQFEDNSKDGDETISHIIDTVPNETPLSVSSKENRICDVIPSSSNCSDITGDPCLSLSSSVLLKDISENKQAKCSKVFFTLLFFFNKL